MICCIAWELHQARIHLRPHLLLIKGPNSPHLCILNAAHHSFLGCQGDRDKGSHLLCLFNVPDPKLPLLSKTAAAKYPQQTQRACKKVGNKGREFLDSSGPRFCSMLFVGILETVHLWHLVDLALPLVKASCLSWSSLRRVSTLSMLPLLTRSRTLEGEGLSI